MEQRYYALRLGLLPSVAITFLVLTVLTLASGFAVFFGQILITQNSVTRIKEQNEMLIVGLKNLTSGGIPIQHCELDGTDQGVFILNDNTIVVNPSVPSTVVRFSTSGIDALLNGNATATDFSKNDVTCCHIAVQGAECVWDNTTYACSDGDALATMVIPSLGVCQVNLAGDQVIGLAIIAPSLDDATNTLHITHPFVVFTGAVFVNETHKLPSKLSDLLVAWNNSRAFTGSQLFPCGVAENNGTNTCPNTVSGNIQYDITMTSWYTGRGGTTINSDTLQADQANAATVCAGGYPISPNPYVTVNDEVLTAETIFNAPISQITIDILQCGNVNEDLPVPLGASPDRVFNPSRTWATTPIFPIARDAVYRIEFGTELVNFFMVRDDDDTGLTPPVSGSTAAQGCAHYFASALDDDESCLSDGDVRDNTDSLGNNKSGKTDASAPLRKAGCDAQSRTENVGPVALQLYALCLGVGVNGSLYESEQGLVTSMFVPLHHRNPTIIDMSEGAKTHKMRGHMYTTIDGSVFDRFPGYFGQCAMFSAATPFYFDKDFAQLYPHLHSQRDIDHGTTFANPLNSTFGNDHFYGYNHFCRASNIVPINAFIEVHVSIPGIDTPAAVVAASELSTGGFSLSKRDVNLVSGAYEDVGKLSAKYWSNYLDPVTGRPDWNKNVEPVAMSRKRFVSPRKALEEYRRRVLNEKKEAEVAPSPRRKKKSKKEKKKKP